MAKIYAYNKGSKALHILGFCEHGSMPEYKLFETEKDAIAYAGKQIFLCKKCEDKREALVQQEYRKNLKNGK
jgi:hypothetical protein